jgi:hypothetical protein
MSNSIEIDNNKHLERYKNKPPSPSYIAGFIDGDGCIFIRKLLNGYQSGIAIYQSRTNILQVIRYHFGGSITSSSSRNNKTENIMTEDGFYHKHNVRNEYNLIIRSNEYDFIIDYIKDHLVVKTKEIEYLNSFRKYVNIPDKNTEKEELYKLCSYSNKNKSERDLNFENINIEYIQGLFDAEGCVYIKKQDLSYYISITQQNNLVLLQKIVEFLGFGNIDRRNTYLIISKKGDCKKFIELVKPGLIVKYNQICEFEKFLDTDDISLKNEILKNTNKEKHEIEIFDCSNTQQSENITKKGYLQKVQYKNNMNKIIKQIHQLGVNRQKSESMKGEKNHNYGKKFSEETRKKMSISIREAKGVVNDEIIIQVRKLLSDGKRNVDIEKIMNLPRHIVTNIKTCDIVCKDEEKVEKVVSSCNERNIKRRKIKLEEIYFILDKFLENTMTQVDILKELNKKREQENIKDMVTIHIIKNMKKSISNENKLPFYEEENPEKYKHYSILLKIN